MFLRMFALLDFVVLFLLVNSSFNSNKYQNNTKQGQITNPQRLKNNIWFGSLYKNVFIQIWKRPL